MAKTLSSGIFIFLLAIVAGTVSAAGTFNPCELLTQQEAAILAGEPVMSPELQESNNPLGQKMCLYTTESSRLIQLSVIRTDDIMPKIRKHGQTAPAIYSATKEMLTPAEPVPDIGDDACWGTLGLHILKGEVYLVVSVGNTSKRENLALARNIALRVVPRL